MTSPYQISRFFLHLSVFAIVLVTTTTLFPFIVGKYAFFRACVYLAVLFFLAGCLRDSAETKLYLERLRNIFRSPFGIALTAFVIATLLSVFFGVNPKFSFWSNFERGEGGFQVLTLYLYFVLLVTLFTDKTYWRRIFGYAMVAALLVILYGMLASGILFKAQQGFIGPSFETPNYRFQGTIGNAAYVAAYLIFILGFALTLLEGKIRKLLSHPSAVITALCIVIYAIFFWLAATRGAFIGLSASLLVGLAYVAYSLPKWRKWLIVAGVVFVVGIFTLISFRESNFVKSLPGSRLFDISLTTDTLRTRTVMWQIAVKGALERPLFGWGPENFPQVFDNHYVTSDYKPGTDFGVWFDRAHSVVFDTLAASGIVGLITYLLVFIMYYVEFFRSRLGTRSHLFIEAIVFSFPVAYFVQGLALFDVLSIYMNLFLLLAFGYFQFHDWRLQKVSQGTK